MSLTKFNDTSNQRHNESAQTVYRKLGFSETDYRFYEEEFADPEKLYTGNWCRELRTREAQH